MSISTSTSAPASSDIRARLSRHCPEPVPRCPWPYDELPSRVRWTVPFLVCRARVRTRPEVGSAEVSASLEYAAKTAC